MRNLHAYKKTVSIVNETSTGLYENFAGSKKGFLLESFDKNNGRYTIFGREPEEIISSEKNSLVILKSDGSREVREGNPVEKLKEYYSEFHVTKDDGELAFIGGLVGSLGYDFIRYTEDLPDDNEDEIGIETIQFMLAKEFIVIDHVAETLTGVVLEADSEEGRTLGEEKCAALVEEVLSSYQPVKEISGVHDGIIVKKSDTLEEYGKKVEKIRHYIKEGDIFQTVLSQRWTIKTKRDGFDLYKELRILNPSPYLYYFNFGEFEIIGSSPEMIVKQ
jgi:anthranilate synthase component 1